jgi:hypothetical protein
MNIVMNSYYTNSQKQSMNSHKVKVMIKWCCLYQTVLSLEELGFKKHLWALIFSQKEQPFVTILLEAFPSFLIHVQIFK